METLICDEKFFKIDFVLFVSNSLHYYFSNDPYLELLSRL